MDIVWTKLALVTYKEILENLNFRWTKKEIKSFIGLTNDMLSSISEERIVHECVNVNLGIRKGIVHKNVSMFYNVDKSNGIIHIITFFNTKMNPKSLMKLLKE
ncbi:MAG: hypothetical protein KAG37_07770 [Flavobacteriales bacterium]|nr:hypothetical protein [Flavobacteriales bacterium]